MPKQTTGRRLADADAGCFPLDYDQLRPGDIWRVIGHPLEGASDTNLTGGVWMMMTPAGSLCTLVQHTVREHDDGTVSVRPSDGSSNSILVSGHPRYADWHGYIEHNVWTEC